MMPGGALYYAEMQLGYVGGLRKEGVDPVIAQNLLAQLNWGLNAADAPPQKPQYYENLKEYQMLYGDHSGGIPGSYYRGPRTPVITTRLRPKDAKPLERVNDN
jgi:hypothetical protein